MSERPRYINGVYRNPRWKTPPTPYHRPSVGSREWENMFAGAAICESNETDCAATNYTPREHNAREIHMGHFPFAGLLVIQALATLKEQLAYQPPLSAGIITSYQTFPFVPDKLLGDPNVMQAYRQAYAAWELHTLEV